MEGTSYAAAINIGHNPTFEGIRSIRIEAHLQGYSGNLYGTSLDLHLLSYLRKELKFPSSEDLVAQLWEDNREVSRIFREWMASSPHEMVLPVV